MWKPADELARFIKKGSEIVFSSVIAFLLIGCASAEKAERQKLLNHFQQLETQLPTVIVDTSNGVSEIEAY